MNNPHQVIDNSNQKQNSSYIKSVSSSNRKDSPSLNEELYIPLSFDDDIQIES